MSARAKIFVEFVAMILRCKMYTKLNEEMKNLEKKPNYMTVPDKNRRLQRQTFSHRKEAEGIDTFRVSMLKYIEKNGTEKETGA